MSGRNPFSCLEEEGAARYESALLNVLWLAGRDGFESAPVLLGKSIALTPLIVKTLTGACMNLRFVLG